MFIESNHNTFRLKNLTHPSVTNGYVQRVKVLRLLLHRRWDWRLREEELFRNRKYRPGRSYITKPVSAKFTGSFHSIQNKYLTNQTFPTTVNPAFWSSFTTAPLPRTWTFPEYFRVCLMYWAVTNAVQTISSCVEKCIFKWVYSLVTFSVCCI